YESLGIKELGATLSCNRDYALIEGFNPDATLVREKTIMSGGDCCTFRYNFSDEVANDIREYKRRLKLLLSVSPSSAAKASTNACASSLYGRYCGLKRLFMWWFYTAQCSGVYGQLG
ncbi:L-2-amino-thiazoline-4-carboxylic acid hydrolase, partial [Planktomarina temperata]|nr:L-2-amino-thiazoline-4-carboxylic acid hydrolase [Planktomarina temperata]